MWKWNISMDIAQRVDERNGGQSSNYVYSRFMFMKMSKKVHFMYLLLNTTKVSLDKIFKCIWKVLLSPFRKYYGLCRSELPFAKFQHLKIQVFLCWLSSIWCLSTISHKQLSPKLINHIIFCKNSIRSSMCT